MNSVTYKADQKDLFNREVTEAGLSSRLLTDYFVQGNCVYENIGSYKEEDSFVIELEEMPHEEPYQNATVHKGDTCLLEYRIFTEAIEDRILIKQYEFTSKNELLPHLLLFRPLLDGVHYNRVSGEYDEDRNVYTVYLSR
ncbi:hypothetical protein [Thalassobacillus hwangdonensis]|uniref:Uncharacterized protein n=1 Tax=Thalassobacillus hwangdonensis TaxID=546108 RepID=A0ABW3L5D1_9BACI